VRVVTTPQASAFIESHGGVAYVRPLLRKCCGGALTVLSATTQTPADAGLYESVGDPSLGVRYRRASDNSGRTGEPAVSEATPDEWTGPGSTASEPQELLVEVRGRRRPHLAACWDGCVFKL
jgi:hypothetical protein